MQKWIMWFWFPTTQRPVCAPSPQPTPHPPITGADRSVADGQSRWRRAVAHLPPLIRVFDSGYSGKAHSACFIDSLTFFVLEVNRKQRWRSLPVAFHLYFSLTTKNVREGFILPTKVRLFSVFLHRFLRLHGPAFGGYGLMGHFLLSPRAVYAK